MPKTKKKPKSPRQKEREFIKNLWSFSWGDTEGEWPLREIDDANVSIRQALHNLEDLSPTDLKKRGCHNVEVDNLSKVARKRLEKIQKDDLDGLHSMRLSGKERIWAIRLRAEDNDGYYHVFKLLWWDPRHEVCPTNPQ